MNETQLKNLAICLLDDDLGITEAAYHQLLSIMPAHLAVQLQKEVEATDGRFYIPEDNTLQDWHINEE